MARKAADRLKAVRGELNTARIDLAWQEHRRAGGYSEDKVRALSARIDRLIRAAKVAAGRAERLAMVA